MTEHPEAADLEGLIVGALEPAQVRLLVAHLLGGCADCAGRLKSAAEVLLLGLDHESAPGAAAAYDPPLERAFAAVVLHGAAAPEKTAQRNAALRALAEGGVTAIDPEHYGLYPTYDALMVIAPSFRKVDLETAGYFYRIAARIASSLPSEGYSPQQAADCAARANGEYANVLRTQDNLPAAEQLLNDAFGKAMMGTGDRSLWLHLRDLQASLLRHQHRYSEAIRLLEEVRQGQLALGDAHLAGRALLTQGVCRGYVEGPSEALNSFEAAYSLIDFEREPRLRAVYLHNRLMFLVEGGFLKEALGLLGAVEQGWSLEVRGLERCKLDSIEGRIHAGLGDFARAELAFWHAREGFREAGAPGHLVSVNLDLALLFLEQNRSDEAKPLVTEALRTFTALKVPHAQAEAMLVLAQVLRQDLLNAAAVRSVVDFLRKSEHDPYLRYQPLG